MIDIARDYANLGAGMVGPLVRRGKHLAAATAAASSRAAINSSLRLAALASRPLRALIR